MTDMEKLFTAVNKMHESNSVDMRGGSYTEVSSRIEVFRLHFGMDYSMQSELLVDDGTRVVIKTSILNKEGVVVAVGHAEEVRGSSKVNQTSAMENCESSSWGRALANLGLHGGKIASVEEVKNAVEQQEHLDAWQSWGKAAIAAVQACQTAEELKAWDDAESQNSDGCAEHAPDVWQSVAAELVKKGEQLGVQ